LWRFAGGDEAYAFALRRFTTTNLTADEIHQIGLKRVAEIEQEMEGVLRRMGRTEGTLAARLKAIEKSQSYPLTDEGRKQIMADTEQILRDAEKRAALQFDRRPKAPVVAQPYPPSARRMPPPATARQRRTDRGPARFRSRCARSG